LTTCLESSAAKGVCDILSQEPNTSFCYELINEELEKKGIRYSGLQSLLNKMASKHIIKLRLSKLSGNLYAMGKNGLDALE